MSSSRRPCRPNKPRTRFGRRGFLGLVSVTFAGAVPGLWRPFAKAAEVEIGQVRYDTYEGASGHFSDGTSEALYPWTKVYAEEKIITPSAGATRLVFLDNTSLRIGPASEVTLDRFVYDPATAQGEVLINLSSGIMRFVTGDISSAEGSVQMQTPHATITVRGTDVVVKTDDEQVEATIVDGEVGVLPTGQPPENEITGQAGTTVTVYKDGGSDTSSSQSNASAEGVGGPSDGSDGGGGSGSGGDPSSGGSDPQ